MTIGERVKARRLELGLSVDEVADALGKNRATVYRYESNEIEKLPTTVLEPLAKVLKVSPGYLMGWEDEETKEDDGKDEINNLQSTVGERLKSIRMKKGVKVSEIAKELGISERAYRNYENNERDLSTMTLLKICLYFDVSSEYILGIDDKTKSLSPAIDGKKALEAKLETLSTESLEELDKFMDYLLWKEEQ